MSATTFYAAILLTGLYWSPPAPVVPPLPEPTPLERAFMPTTRTMTLEIKRYCTFPVEDKDGWTACLHYEPYGFIGVELPS